MKAEIREQVEKIIGTMKCPKDFRCAEHDFEQLCKAQDYGNEKYVMCLEEKPPKCPFSIPFGLGGYCKCPLRVYLCKEMQPLLR